MLFVSLEGLDGSGKTTIIQKLKDKLVENNYDVLVTREPGGNIISEKIREILLNKNNYNMDYWTEALLYIASRKQHLVEVILPALKENKIVICDRFLDSTIAYQGFGRKLPIKDLELIQNTVIGKDMPNLTLFLDVGVHITSERILKRGEFNRNRLDLEKEDFYKRVQDGYNFLLNNSKNRIVKINASLDIIDVVNDCYNTIIKKII